MDKISAVCACVRARLLVLGFHSLQECRRKKERIWESEWEKGTFPRLSEDGGREEADSGSDGRQEQIQEEGK